MKPITTDTLQDVTHQNKNIMPHKTIEPIEFDEKFPTTDEELLKVRLAYGKG